MKKRFLFAALSVLLLRAADLGVTYLYTPDLSFEFNPIVSLLGMSWIGFIGFQIVFLLLILGAGACSFFLSPVTVGVPGLNMTDFVYCYFYGKLKPWYLRVFSFPGRMRSHAIFVGFLLMAATSGASVFAIINNLLLLGEISWYSRFVEQHYMLFFPGIFLIIIYASAILFFTREYRLYKNYSDVVKHTKPGVIS